MNIKVPQLSIFFPFWNEEKNIENVIIKAISVAEKVAQKWEIIIVDDGSSDRTLDIAKRLTKEFKNVRLVSHQPNRGYGAALKDGFRSASYNIVAFIDGDGQFDFSQVTKFLEKMEDADIVIGYRKKRRDNITRHTLMYLLKAWDLVFFGLYFKDIDCGFKMFRREALDAIMPLQSEGAMITTEILVKARLKRLRIVEVEVLHYPRKYGDQSGGNLYVVIRAILESFTLWWNIMNGRI